MKRERCLPILPYTVISIHHKCNIDIFRDEIWIKKHLRWNSWRGEGHCNRIFRIVFVIANKFSAIRLHYSITCINHLSESQWAFQREFLSVQFRLSYQATMFKSALLRKGHRVSRKNRALIVRFVFVPWQITIGKPPPRFWYAAPTGEARPVHRECSVHTHVLRSSALTHECVFRWAPWFASSGVFINAREHGDEITVSLE